MAHGAQPPQYAPQSLMASGAMEADAQLDADPHHYPQHPVYLSQIPPHSSQGYPLHLSPNPSGSRYSEYSPGPASFVSPNVLHPSSATEPPSTSYPHTSGSQQSVRSSSSSLYHNTYPASTPGFERAQNAGSRASSALFSGHRQLCSPPTASGRGSEPHESAAGHRGEPPALLGDLNLELSPSMSPAVLLPTSGGGGQGGGKPAKVRDASEVEVKVDATERWFCGVLLEAVLSESDDLEHLIVDFGGSWGRRSVETGCVRRAPLPPDTPLDFASGDEVEIEMRALEGGQPACWIKGRLGDVDEESKGTMLVTIVDAEGKEVDRRVSKARIRPAASVLPFPSCGCFAERYGIPEVLNSWIAGEEGKRCLSMVQHKTSLVFLQVLQETQPQLIVLVGDGQSARRARTLLNVHFKHQRGVQGFQERRERRLRLLEERRSSYFGMDLVEFLADEAMIGLVIGKQGDKLSRVARDCKVEIRVLPDEGGMRRVRIYGSDPNSLRKAQQLLEILYKELPLDVDFANWILSKKMSIVRDVSQTAGLHSAWFDEESNTLILCGLHSAVVDATDLLEAHARHFRQDGGMYGPDTDGDEQSRGFDMSSARGSRRGGREDDRISLGNFERPVRFQGAHIRMLWGHDGDEVGVDQMPSHGGMFDQRNDWDWNGADMYGHGYEANGGETLMAMLGHRGPGGILGENGMQPSPPLRSRRGGPGGGGNFMQQSSGGRGGARGRGGMERDRRAMAMGQGGMYNPYGVIEGGGVMAYGPRRFNVGGRHENHSGGPMVGVRPGRGGDARNMRRSGGY